MRVFSRILGFVFSGIVSGETLMYFWLKKQETRIIIDLLYAMYAEFRNTPNFLITRPRIHLVEEVLVKRFRRAERSENLVEILKVIASRPFRVEATSPFDSRFAKVLQSRIEDGDISLGVETKVRLACLLSGAFDVANIIVESVLLDERRYYAFGVITQAHLEILLGVVPDFSPSIQEVILQRAIDCGLENFSVDARASAALIDPNRVGNALPKAASSDHPLPVQDA